MANPGAKLAPFTCYQRGMASKSDGPKCVHPHWVGPRDGTTVHTIGDACCHLLTCVLLPAVTAPLRAVKKVA